MNLEKSRGLARKKKEKLFFTTTIAYHRVIWQPSIISRVLVTNDE